MSQLSIGTRVEMVYCVGCAAGTITGVRRNRWEVIFDDMPNSRWLLRSESLKMVEREQAKQLMRTNNRKELA